jgi:sec-independent protein translocase protein TatA
MPLALGAPGIGPLLIVLAVVVIVFGPKRIPMLARQLGSGLREFRKSVDRDHDNDQLSSGPGHEQAPSSAQSAEQQAPQRTPHD